MTAPPPPQSARRLTLRARLAAAFIVVWLAVQIAIPLRQLWQPRPARFGWHMYAGSRPLRLRAVRTDGQRVRLQPRRYLANLRYDFSPEYLQVLAAHVCRVEPALQTVEATEQPSGRTVRERCGAGARR